MHHNITGVFRITRDPELANSKTPILKLGLVSQSNHYDKEAREYKPAFFEAILIGDRVPKLMDYLTKGKQIQITGAFETHSWKTDNQEKRSKLQLTIERLSFVGSKADTAASTSDAGTTRLKETFGAHTPQNDENDLPF